MLFVLFPNDFRFRSAVKEEAIQNLKPDLRSRFNAMVEHQAITTSIALVPNQAPTTRVTDDGMHITHRETHLDIKRWRHGYLRLCDEVEKEIGRASCRERVSCCV